MKNLIYIGVMSLVLAICSRATAQEAPVIVNPQTGAVVNLARAHWNANVDIASKRMQCDYYSFDDETGVFVKGRDRSGAPIYQPDNPLFYNNQYTHMPIPNGTTPVNIAFVELSGGGNLDRHMDPPFWSVIDGVYKGPAPFSTSEFVEIVAFNASTDNAVRVWYPDQPVPAYSVCYDLDATQLLPTGTVGSGNTQLVDLEDFTFDFPDAYESIPEIINQETGESVQISRGRWSYNKDIAGKIITCESYFWNSNFYQRIPDSGFRVAYYPYNGGENIQRSTRQLIDQSFFWISDQPVSTVELPHGFDNSYMEITEFGYRMWVRSTSFEKCDVEAVVENTSFAPTELLPLIASDTLQEVTDNCDYTDADDYDGWGFDPVTMNSCPPLDNNNSVDEITEATNSTESTDAIEGVDGMETSASPVDNAPDEMTGDVNNAGVSEPIVDSNITQTTPDPAGNSTNDSSGDSDAAGTEDTVAEDEDSSDGSNSDLPDTRNNSTTTDQVSSDQNTSQSGGGSIWLPFLIFVLALRRQTLAIQKRY